MDKDSLFDVCELTSNANGIATVLEDYICCNAISIAESHYYPEFKPKALYCEQALIGFFMYRERDLLPNEAQICRYMLDHKFIGQGLGKKTFSAIIDYFKAKGLHRVTLGVDNENNIAKNLYISHGFTYTGEIVDGEYIYSLKLI
ncbi:GNAT family N-acetyltransferase [Providencia manganoxydans]|uniref:GNAT family N-acetyltransferase n=1 Tax=Providencia manganoxydans TaxID=2923283 RepID=UPI0034E5E6A0